MRLDKLSIGEAIELMLREDAKIPRILLRERTRIETAIRLIVRAFRRGDVCSMSEPDEWTARRARRHRVPANF